MSLDKEYLCRIDFQRINFGCKLAANKPKRYQPGDQCLMFYLGSRLLSLIAVGAEGCYSCLRVLRDSAARRITVQCASVEGELM